MNTTRPDMVLKYKADASRNGLLVIIATAPVWAIFIPFLIVDMLRSTFSLFGAALFLVGIMLCAIATVFVCRDNRLVIGERGIKIPVRFALEALGRRQFHWDELKQVVFQKQGKPAVDAEEISFQFKHGTATMRLEGFQVEEIPKILLSLQAYAPQARVLPESKALSGIAPEQLATPLSFTQIWEQELMNRFGSTIFVPLEPGHELQSGRIKVVGQIAFGGLSAIYLAKTDEAIPGALHAANQKEHQLVVLKEAVVPQNADEASKEKALELFNREAKFLATLSHPRIARVLDHFVEQGRNYLLLQYIEGKDLRTYIKENGAQPEPVVARWAQEIAQILVYLHSLNPPIIHRDLTPDNLVLARDGSICLIDFGAANNFVGTATGTLVGKQSYISPEQFRGKATPESDLYSLGCTLHYLLTGKDPEPLSMCHPKLENAQISPAMDELVANLTEQEVCDRVRPSTTVLDRIEKLCDVLIPEMDTDHHARVH